MIEYARILVKSSEGLPTIPPSASHDNGDWSSNDIYENEFYIDSLTGYVYTRKGDTIVLVSTTGAVIEVVHDDSLTGDGTAGAPLGIALDPSIANQAEITAGGLLVNPTKWLEIEVLNNGADPLPKMAVCYFKTSSSSADTPEILLADNSSEATSSKTMGLLKDTIAPGATGKLILVGEYNAFDTSAYNVGQRLWLGNFGGIITDPPEAPRHAVFLGIVSRSHHTQGRICIAIQNGYELEELHNVTSEDYTTPQDEDSILTFDSTEELWKRLTFQNLVNYLSSFFQAFLVSGTNIKTINGSSILGGGDFLTIPQLTSVQRDALTPVAGYPIYNTTEGYLEIYDTFWGWMPVSGQNEWMRKWGFEYWNDNVLGDQILQTLNLGGSSFLASTTSYVANNKPGKTWFILGTSAGSSLRILSQSPYALGGGRIIFEAGMVPTALSNSTNRFVYLVGFFGVAGQALTAQDQTNGAYFLYDEGGVSSGSSASPNWQCVTAANGVRTFTTTSVPHALNASYKLWVAVNDNASEVLFYINETLVATHNTNIPKGTSQLVGWGIGALRIAGTGGTSAGWADYIGYKQKFTTPR